MKSKQARKPTKSTLRHRDDDAAEQADQATTTPPPTPPAAATSNGDGLDFDDITVDVPPLPEIDDAATDADADADDVVTEDATAEFEMPPTAALGGDDDEVELPPDEEPEAEVLSTEAAIAVVVVTDKAGPPHRLKRPARSDPSGKSYERGPGAAAAAEVHAPRPVVTMDHRDLSKSPRNARQKMLRDWSGAQRAKTLDKYMQSVLATSKRKYGHSAVLAGHADENLIVGIPCPLPFEYLLCQDVMPLGLIYQIVGMPGSLKSSLLYEVFRWFRNAGGISNLEEVETKFSPELLRSVVNFKRGENSVEVTRCSSVEDWQQKILYHIVNHQNLMSGTKKEPGPGRTVPVCFGVDSVSGKLSMETQEKVKEQGFHGRSYPIEAMSITGFMKTVPHMIDGWPFTIVLNNHLKEGSDDAGHKVRRITGGSGLNFQESFEIETKVVASKLECADWEGVGISIKCTKNSFGTTGRKIDARMLWWEEKNEETGDFEQVTRWDWHWSTVKLLSTIKGMAGARLAEAGIHVVTPKTSPVENTAWSKTLGMKEKDAIPWSELGARIAADDKMTRTIRECLAVKKRPLLQGDYLKQQEQLAKKLP